MIHSRPPSPLLFLPLLLFPSLSLPFLPLPLYPPQTRCKRVEGMRSVAKMTIASAWNIAPSTMRARLKRLNTYFLRQPSLCCCAARTSLGQRLQHVIRRNLKVRDPTSAGRRLGDHPWSGRVIQRRWRLDSWFLRLCSPRTPQLVVIQARVKKD